MNIIDKLLLLLDLELGIHMDMDSSNKEGDWDRRMSCFYRGMGGRYRSLSVLAELLFLLLGLVSR